MRWLLILLLLGGTVQAAMPDRVNVKLFQACQPITDIQIQQFHWSKNKPLSKHVVLPGGPVRVQCQNKTLNRTYAGQLIVSLDHQRLHVINRVPVRDYVASVVSSENPKGWPVEALKAQAVITQTRLLKGNGAMLTDTTQDELYLGSAVVRPEVTQAVNAVWGKALFYHNSPVMPFYHSTCAGSTRDWGLPYLSPVKCNYCKASPFWKPTIRLIPKAQFESKLGKLPLKTDYKLWMKLGQQFGWDKAPGVNFSLTRLGEQIQVRSVGAGHGVGLCQWGGAGLAKQGKTSDEILRYYFPKLVVREF